MITHIVSDWLFSPCCVEHQDEFIFERVAVAYSRDYNEVGRAQIKGALNFVYISCIHVLLESNFVKKMHENTQSKIVNNFECIVKTLFVRKLSQDFFLQKHHFLKITKCENFLKYPTNQNGLQNNESKLNRLKCLVMKH